MLVLLQLQEENETPETATSALAQAVLALGLTGEIVLLILNMASHCTEHGFTLY